MIRTKANRKEQETIDILQPGDKNFHKFYGDPVKWIKNAMKSRAGEAMPDLDAEARDKAEWAKGKRRTYTWVKDRKKIYT